MKIATLLPYKENFSPNDAGAVSLFVNDITNKSIYKKNTYIFGNTHAETKLSNNYINLNLDKKIFQSTSKRYVQIFLDYEKKIKTDIIEVHNRPNYIRAIKSSYRNKIILYFHNDPLTMNGSKKKSDRIYLINNVDKIIFNSNWSKKRFFLDLTNKELLSQKTSVCYQSAPNVKIEFKKKKKIITFIGKLNTAKGYDLFGGAIIKILSKYKDWKAHVIGNEPREKLIFNHERLKILGFKSNKFILNFLKKVSISVICSRWDEPFGRTSLEAASRGCAVIISNKGGLPETCKNAVILKSLTQNEVYKSIENLILNREKLIKLQKLNHKNFIFNHKYIANIIDKLRSQFSSENNVKTFNIKKDLIIKILHITNFNNRFSGRLHYNTGRRLNNGLIRLGHNVLSISDRDIVNKSKSFRDPKGIKSLQNSIIESFNNFNPDHIILGHADAVSLETLDYLKSKKNNLKMSQWFLDPLGINGPDYIKNTKRISDKKDFMNATFLTTDPKSLSLDIPNSYFIPNPCDHSFEILKNYENSCENDIFFAMSHGVHRGGLKDGKTDNREQFINKLIKKNKDLKFDIYGMNNVQPIWGDNFINKISNSSMGLNLSRGKPVKYYSSDRITQLIGNGLLTFIDEKTFYKDFFSDNEMIFYKDINDLSYKLNKYKRDHKSRKMIAKNGKDLYFKYFNSTIVSDFIISKTFDIKSKNNFIWNS
ncbi:glycosyltransferase [Candidatus Pelagibacter sp.]|nr:glycosyltransferase [Candidatus Pelagibacter sp.]